MVITGRVQGVFFRASAAHEGLRLCLAGRVENLPSGEVQAEVEGPEAAVDAFAAWCRVGPPGARVSDVKVRKGSYRGDLSGFVVKR
jgi:acylphosphatase